MTIRIVVDERERNSKIPDLLRQAGVHVDHYQLKIGDYIISSNCAVERKTVKDLINSIYDGRLFIQCYELSKFYDKPVVIVEGNMLELLENDENISDLDYESGKEKLELTLDALSKVALNFSIPVLHTPNSEYTSKLLIYMTKILKEEKNDGPFIKRIKKGNQQYLQQLNILSSLPGIGNKLAVRMLQRFQTPQRALNASISEMSKVPGLSSSTAEKIRKVLDQPIKIDKLFDQKKLFDK